MASLWGSYSRAVIIGYARVSTDKAEQAISIAEQVRQLKAAGCDRVIAERRSAHHGARPGWQELQGLVAAGRVRCVVAVSLARLSRQGEDVPFLRMCQRRGVEVRLLDGTPADTADPSGKLLTGVLSLVNEIDSDIKGINVRNGLLRRKTQGHYACGRVPFGYLYNGSQVVPHPDNWPRAQELWQQLESTEFNMPGTIRRYQLDWSPRGLGRWINNPILRGIINHEPNRVEALISWEQWQQATRLIDSRRINATRAPRVIRTFSGLMRCNSCNRFMHYAMAAKKPRLKCTHILCRWYGRGLAEWKIRDQVIAALRNAAEHMASIAAAPVEMQPTAEDLAKRQQISQLEALHEQGVPGLAPTIEAMRLELLAPPPQTSANWAGFRDVIRQPGVLELASVEELRAIALELIDELVYVGDPNRIEIRLRDGASDDPP
jgi:DNA invertase Pin-like site-specific DNA recombinase